MFLFSFNNMKSIEYNEEKRLKLMKEREIDLEEVKKILQNNGVIATIENNNYPNQKIFVILYKGYHCWVPFVVSEETVFLKTAYLSRKLKRLYS